MRPPAHLLPLDVCHELGIWVVADRWTRVYGDGPTLFAARLDYLVCLREWWQWRRSWNRR